MKHLWKSTGVKVWFSVTAFLLALLITATCVVTIHPFLYNTISSVLGGERFVIKKGNPEDYVYYTSDYASKNETLEAANALNELICEEGIILLKNENETLPLKQNKKITVFGNASTNLVLGGSGSNAGSVQQKEAASIYSSLTDAGFTFNPVLKKFYEDESTTRPPSPGMGVILTGFPVAETPVESYTQVVRDSYQQYSDAALVVISRIGGEGFDLPRTMFWNGSNYTTWSGNQIIPGARSVDDHYLQLDNNETDMLNEACNNFDKVIVIINSSAPLELGFLDDSQHYAYHQNIKAALWIGNPGFSGANALGRVLNGSVNPSGKTIDTYSRDFKHDPSWNNFGNNLKADGNRYTLNGTARNAYFVEYREGIYVGYRYYETRGFTEAEAGNAGWYKENVVYPFGYGLSYTTFDWEISSKLAQDSILAGDSVIEVEVNVTNTGEVAGKDVVQLYYTAPYTSGGVEKAHVILGDFNKTKLLAPGESDTVLLTLSVRDMASYDYNDANNNGFKGYEVESGRYDIKIMRDAHTVVDTVSYTVADGIKYSTDAVTKAPINNLFDDVSGHIDTYLSRSDFAGTWPRVLTAEDLAASQEFVNSLTYVRNDKETDPWYYDTLPGQAPQDTGNKDAVMLYHLYGKDYDDEMWDIILDRLTVSQMKELISQGNYRTISIQAILKPMTTDADGPMGFTIFMGDPAIYDTCYYASECVVGATWNDELAFEMGKMVGNEGLIGNEKGDGRPYSGWYAPAMNIHRSQFGGRNFEYYSEDGLLSGKLASAVVQGANSKGVYTYCKHFALNDQETNRDTTGLITWANEQSMRELYFIPFEIAVKEGKTTAIMSAFNRIGTTWAGGSYPLLTELLRDEWGFRGMVITDFNLKPYMNLDQMIRAGGDLNLSPGKVLSQDSSTTSIAATRRATKNILYTVVNSNATNGLGEGIVFGYKWPYWLILLICADCLVAAALGLWGFFTIRKAQKTTKKYATKALT